MAHRAGIERVILPKRNQKDLRDVPPEVRANMQFTFVSNMDDVLRLALLPSPGRSGAVLADQRVIDTPVESHVEPRVVAAPNGDLASPVPTVLTAS